MTARSPLFAAGALRAIELDAGDVPALQRFFDKLVGRDRPDVS